MKAQSSWISEAHGKLGGAVFRSTRHGMVISSKHSPIKRETSIIADSFNASPLPLMPSYKQVYSAAVKRFTKYDTFVQHVMRFRPDWMSPLAWFIYFSYSNALTNGLLFSDLSDKMTRNNARAYDWDLGWEYELDNPDVKEPWPVTFQHSQLPFSSASAYRLAFGVSALTNNINRPMPQMYMVAGVLSNFTATTGFAWANYDDSIKLLGAGTHYYNKSYLIVKRTGQRIILNDGWYQLVVEPIE